MQAFKTWSESLTIKAILVGFVAWLFSKIGYTLDQGVAQNVVEWIANIAQVAALLVAAIGRIRATHRITLSDIPTPPAGTSGLAVVILASVALAAGSMGCAGDSVDADYRNADRATYAHIAPITSDLIDGKRTPADFEPDEVQAVHDTLDTWSQRISAGDDATTQP